MVCLSELVATRNACFRSLHTSPLCSRGDARWAVLPSSSSCTRRGGAWVEVADWMYSLEVAVGGWLLPPGCGAWPGDG